MQSRKIQISKYIVSNNENCIGSFVNKYCGRNTLFSVTNYKPKGAWLIILLLADIILFKSYTVIAKT